MQGRDNCPRSPGECGSPRRVWAAAVAFGRQSAPCSMPGGRNEQQASLVFAMMVLQSTTPIHIDNPTLTQLSTTNRGGSGGNLVRTRKTGCFTMHISSIWAESVNSLRFAPMSAVRKFALRLPIVLLCSSSLVDLAGCKAGPQHFLQILSA